MAHLNIAVALLDPARQAGRTCLGEPFGKSNSPLSPTNGKEMTLSDSDSAMPTDGRQSIAALQIARGTRRLLLAHGFSSLPELSLANGRRADLVGLSERGVVWIVEIKSSVEDFRVDQKWPEYREFCDQLLFAVSPSFPLDLLPPDTGIIVADRFGGDFIREAPIHMMAATRRKALVTRIARTGAMRLLALSDPEIALERSWQE